MMDFGMAGDSRSVRRSRVQADHAACLGYLGAVALLAAGAAAGPIAAGGFNPAGLSLMAPSLVVFFGGLLLDSYGEGRFSGVYAAVAMVAGFVGFVASGVAYGLLALGL